MFKRIFFGLVCTLFFGTIPSSVLFAQDSYGQTESVRENQADQQSFLFDKDVSYDVYYEVTAYEVHRIENVRIQEIIDINNEPFMVVQFPGMTSRVGYIHLTSVRAILPTGAPRPNRSAELRKY
jgi:hypothetical protein